MKKQHPDYPTLRLAAARLLDGNPDLAQALQADLDGRRKVDEASTAALQASLRAEGVQMGLSVASQYRHPDWRDRAVDTPLPSGPTRTFYHFTSAVHLPVLLKYGLSRGDVCVHPSDPSRNFNAPWLTDDPSFRQQGWAEGPDGQKNSVFDSCSSRYILKRDVRLTVEIPEGDASLHTWAEVCLEAEIDEFWRDALNSCGGAEHWFVYNGLIPRPWITQVEFRNTPEIRGAFGFFRLGDFPG